MPKDQVFYLRDGWHCIVDGRVFGTWDNRGAAIAGMQTEQRRSATRK